MAARIASQWELGRQLLPISVAHDEASIVEFFNRPWWWEAASGGFGLRLAFAS
jgi:hypothetical protein